MIPVRLGGRTSRYGFNAHNTRDLAISLLNTVNGLNPQCIEFWAGHEIDKLGYNQFYALKPDYVVEQYRLAEPYLNIVSNWQPEGNKDLSKQNDQLKEIVKQQGEAIARLTGLWEERFQIKITD